MRVAAHLRDRPFLVEAFVLSNLAFLVLDVFIAHSVNAFRNPAEWIPIFFAVLGSLALAAGLGLGLRGREKTAHWAGLVVGWISLAVGIAGLFWHLESNFFQQTTLRSLVYSAPFAAPLAFSGLGFLLLLDRMVPTTSVEWGWWVLFFALGGFIGNFALSLSDHAQNGFFNSAEWIPVVVSALGIGALVTALVRPLDPLFLRVCMGILLLQVLTGVAGFGIHAFANVHGPSERWLDNFLYGAPVFAPLLFADLALLAALGLWDLSAKGGRLPRASRADARSQPGRTPPKTASSSHFQ